MKIRTYLHKSLNGLSITGEESPSTSILSSLGGMGSDDKTTNCFKGFKTSSKSLASLSKANICQLDNRAALIDDPTCFKTKIYVMMNNRISDHKMIYNETIAIQSFNTCRCCHICHNAFFGTQSMNKYFHELLQFFFWSPPRHTIRTLAQLILNSNRIEKHVVFSQVYHWN